jgi:hypothetical protein
MDANKNFKPNREWTPRKTFQPQMDADEIQFKSADFVWEYANVRERIETVVPETAFLFLRTAENPKE